MEPEGLLPCSQGSAAYPDPEPDQSTPSPQPTPWKWILILSCHLLLSLINGPFALDFPTKLCIHLPSRTSYMPCSCQSFRFRYRPWGSKLCNPLPWEKPHKNINKYSRSVELDLQQECQPPGTRNESHYTWNSEYEAVEPKVYPLLWRGKTQTVSLHSLTAEVPARPQNRSRGIYGGQSDITKGFIGVLRAFPANIIPPNAP